MHSVGTLCIGDDTFGNSTVGSTVIGAVLCGVGGINIVYGCAGGDEKVSKCLTTIVVAHNILVPIRIMMATHRTTKPSSIREVMSLTQVLLALGISILVACKRNVHSPNTS